MKNDRLMLCAGGLASFTALVHILAGTPEIQGPLRASALPAEVSWLLLACWHLVSVALAVSGLSLFWCARAVNRPRAGVLPVVLGLMWLGFGAVIVFAALRWQGARGLLALPQWTLLLPVGLLALMSARRQR